MQIRFLGTDSHNGGSPTLFATDRGTLVVRGYAITDAQALADLGDVPAASWTSRSRASCCGSPTTRWITILAQATTARPVEADHR